MTLETSWTLTSHIASLAILAYTRLAWGYSWWLVVAQRVLNQSEILEAAQQTSLLEPLSLATNRRTAKTVDGNLWWRLLSVEMRVGGEGEGCVQKHFSCESQLVCCPSDRKLGLASQRTYERWLVEMIKGDRRRAPNKCHTADVISC